MVGVIQLVTGENELYIQPSSVPILQSIRWHLEVFLPSDRVKQEHSENHPENHPEKNQSHLDREGPVELKSCSKDFQGFVCCTFQPAETAVCKGRSRVVPRVRVTLCLTPLGNHKDQQLDTLKHP